MCSNADSTVAPAPAANKTLTQMCFADCSRKCGPGRFGKLLFTHTVETKERWCLPLLLSSPLPPTHCHVPISPCCSGPPRDPCVLLETYLSMAAHSSHIVTEAGANLSGSCSGILNGSCPPFCVWSNEIQNVSTNAIKTIARLSGPSPASERV